MSKEVQNNVYMKGPATVPSANAMRPPSMASTSRIGISQYFFLARRNAMNSRTKDIGGSELSQEIAGRGRRRRARDPITAFPGAGSQAKRIFSKESHDKRGGGDDEEEYGGHCDRGNEAANQSAEFCPQSENRYCRDRYKRQPCASDPGCDEPEPRGPGRECGPHSCGYTSDAKRNAEGSRGAALGVRVRFDRIFRHSAC